MKERNEKKKSMYTYVKNQKGLVIILLVIAVAFFLLIIPESKEASSVNHSQRLSDYETRIEEKIEKLCSEVKGVYKVKVSVYFDTGFETVYAYNEETKSSNSGSNSEKKYVTVGSGNDESMVTLFERMPNISGVAVVCQGGGNAIVANEIINMISSAFNVPKNKIYVTEGKN